MTKKKFPDEVTKEEREEIFKYLDERFGISPIYFQNYLILKGATNYWLFPKTPLFPQLKGLIPEVVGLLFLRRVSHYLKPTSSFIQRFGRYATKNIVTLTKEELSVFREKNSLEINLELTPGYVVVKDENWIIGCGLYLPGKLYVYLSSLRII